MNEITKELLDALKGAVAQMNFAAECVERGRHDEAILHLRSLTRGRSEAIAKAEAILAAPQPADDGWIPWEGGERPVTHNTTVEVRLRNGWEGDLLASAWHWHHATQESSDAKEVDIIAYRVVKP